MNIITYHERYKDPMIAMVREARLAIGLSPTVREDLYDIKSNYLDKGDQFWLAIDDRDQVVGCLGFSRIPGTTEAFLHRFYIAPNKKRRGVGTKLLETAESYMKAQGITVSKVHLGTPREQWFESYAFYPKHGYREYEPRYLYKEI